MQGAYGDDRWGRSSHARSVHYRSGQRGHKGASPWWPLTQWNPAPGPCSSPALLHNAVSICHMDGHAVWLGGSVGWGRGRGQGVHVA